MSTMDKANIINQMEQYDFGTPINVTMIFEDSDEEPYHHVLREWRRNSANKQKGKCCRAQQKTDKKNDSITPSAPLEKKFQDNSSSTKENNTTANIIDVSEVNSISISSEIMSNQIQNKNSNCMGIKNTNNNIIDKSTHSNKTAELSEHINPLLDIVSEHLVLITIKYYSVLHQIHGKNTAKAAEKKSEFNEFKFHMFDLSYSIVVSIIIPQEKNDLFVETLLNKTVVEANKVLSWKCNRKHIEPFYLEMIRWVKLKKKYLPTLGFKSTHEQKNNNMSTNENRLLKSMLADSRLSLNTASAPKELDGTGVPTDKNVPSLSDQVVNITTDNNLCIFSSGHQGRNVSISINPNMFFNQTTQQYTVTPQTSTTLIPVRNNNCTRNSTVLHNYDPRRNHLEQNTYPQSQTIHHRPVSQRPPPHYDAIHHSSSNATIPNYKNLSQINDKIAPSLQNYQIQQNLAASANANSHFGQMYHTQVENLPTATPVITHVSPLHANDTISFPTNGHCSVCGINTNLRCPRCNNLSYCSSLCQELDAGSHNAVCRQK